MKFYPRPSPPTDQKKYFLIPIPQISPETARRISLMLTLIILSNIVSHYWLRDSPGDSPLPKTYSRIDKPLYLLDKARTQLDFPEDFAFKVKQVARKLDVPPSWLMAVMFAESGFDPNVFNRKGSGAVGLIQFMPTTAKELDVPVSSLSYMSATEQMDYVYRYFDMVKDRYGNYESLTDLYLAVLYPKARKEGPCYTLYANPSKSYKQNQGLDENKDGRVTVSDIERRMNRLFPEAFYDSLAEN